MTSIGVQMLLREGERGLAGVSRIVGMLMNGQLMVQEEEEE